MRAVRETLLVRRRPATIDFSETRKMYVEATLLLFAELHRALLLLKDPSAIEIQPPRNRKVLEVLKQIGLLDLVGCKDDVTPSAEDVVHWCAAHGRRADGPEAGSLIERTTGTLAEPIKRGLYAGLTEAMANASEHAYLEQRSDGCGKPSEVDWWVFSQLKDNQLTVVICDLGIGISRSLPLTFKDNSSLRRRLARLVGNVHRDEEAIQLALEVGRTRTAVRHRGYGLFRNIRGVVQHAGSGSMFIASNRGCYMFGTSQIPSATKETTRRLRRSIQGTIVGWSLPLGQEGSNAASSN